MVKKTFYTLINTLSLLIIAVAVAVLLLVLFTPSGQAPQVLGYTMLRVTTGSMEPTYAIDTLIIVKKEAPSEIQEGDIISFYSSDPALDGAVNTHRVTAVEKQTDGSYTYRTKGDANNVEDTYEVHSKYLLGKVIASSLALGKLSRLAANPLIFVPVILVPLFLILLTNLLRTIRLAGKIAKDEEQAAVREALEELRRKKEQDEKEPGGMTQGKLEQGEPEQKLPGQEESR